MNWPISFTSLEPLDKKQFDLWLKSQETWWQVEPDIPRVSRGVKDRVSRLKAIGNGQVSRCMAYAFSKLSEGITTLTAAIKESGQ